MHRSIAWTLLAWTLAGAMARADAPPDPAGRAWEITDVILARHVDPPTRQQMILAGLKAVATAEDNSHRSDLALRVSNLTTPEQLASLLAEIWAGSKQADRATRETQFFKGMLAIVPGNPELLSPKERKVADQIEGNVYVGIQVALGMDEAARRPVFQQILEGGPADHAGARSGDIIDAIGGVSAEGMPMTDVVDRLRGEAGTDVEVKFHRPNTGEAFTKAMTRGRLPRTTVEGFVGLPDKHWRIRLEGNPPIGYLKIKEISGSTPQELRALAEQAESDGLQALMLDFRELREASFHPTLLLADALLDGGTIGVVKSTDGSKTYRAEPDALFRGYPIVIIAEGSIPPEAAWLIDALVDNHRASVVGKPTITGEAELEEKVALADDEWSIQMTTGRMLRGDGSKLSIPVAKRSRTFANLAEPRNEEANTLLQPYTFVPAAPGVAPGPNRYLNPVRPNDVGENPLIPAREILEKAIKRPEK